MQNSQCQAGARLKSADIALNHPQRSSVRAKSSFAFVSPHDPQDWFRNIGPMSLPVVEGAVSPPTTCVEMMNSARVQMLAEVARVEAAMPSPVIKMEDTPPPPPVTGANCAPVGDATLRALRGSSQGHRLGGLQPTGSSVNTVSRALTAPVSASLKRPYKDADEGSKNDKGTKRHKHGYYTKVLSLGQAPTPNPDTKYLTSLLQNRTLTLCLQPPLKKGELIGIPKTHEFRISQAGLIQHETLSALGYPRALPLSLHDQDICGGDGPIMRTVRGQLLEDVWSGLSKQMKFGFARQLHNLLSKMRTQANPAGNMVGSVHSGQYTLLLDKHAEHTYYAIRTKPTQKQFMALLMSTLYDTVPNQVAQALISQFRTSYDTVLTHGALCPRNIVVCNDTIAWIVGWDCAGHYPAWWEYVRFFEARTAEKNSDWYGYARDIFDDEFTTELAAYQGLGRCQQP
ncbi:hypothetical protein BHE90_008249 [Fusarium euwallaceae]|uniref:Aminoglycoside phosphotransferase domain-containing protein n=1 Tax=Fusarium euwallaceae TaxID=1147111 RepID=A0A430LNH3_9HYPO|nr:hypothetical protein BHE90_008249 [Fusarium euwallaceae]